MDFPTILVCPACFDLHCHVISVAVLSAKCVADIYGTLLLE